MKTLFQILFISIFTLSINAQSTIPKTPEPPSSGDSNSSVSTSKSEGNLRFKARWSNKSRYSKLKTFLIEQLGEEGLTISGNTYKWSKESDAFNCKLTGKTMSLSLDYKEASKSLINQVDEMMDNLKYAMKGKNSKEQLKYAQKDLENAEKKLEKAQKEVEKAKEKLAKAELKAKGN